MDLIFDQTNQVIMIPTEWILPTGSSSRQIRNIGKMSYPDRIAKFCSDEQQKMISKMMSAHPTSRLSEYFNG